MACQPVASLTSYGATQTTKFTTTVTAAPSQGTFAIIFPNPLIIEPLQYTTLPPPLDPASKCNPSSLPILIVTDVVAVILNANGVPVSTGTSVQTPPVQPTISRADLMTPGCSSWKCWTPGQRAGTTVAIVIFIIATIAVMWWGFCCKPRNRGNGWRGPPQDLESASDSSQQSNDSVSRRRSRSRSTTTTGTTSSFASSSVSVSSRLPRIPPYPATSISSRVPRVLQHPPRSSSLPMGYPQPRRVVQGQRPQMMYESRQPSPPAGTSIRDFAIPTVAGFAAAGLGAATRRRSASTQTSQRPSVRELSPLRVRQGSVLAGTTARNRSQRKNEEHHEEERPRRTNSNRGRARARR
jgi:hypothetical protein